MTIHSLLTPENSTMLFIDHQPQMVFGVASIAGQLLMNNTIGLAKAARVFNVPTILTTVETKSFNSAICGRSYWKSFPIKRRSNAPA